MNGTFIHLTLFRISESVSNMENLILYLNYNLDISCLRVFYKLILITFLSAVFNNSHIRKHLKSSQKNLNALL